MAKKLASIVVAEAYKCRLCDTPFFHSLDMSELVANVKGPSEWFCEDGKNCWYNGRMKKIFSVSQGWESIK